MSSFLLLRTFARFVWDLVCLTNRDAEGHGKKYFDVFFLFRKEDPMFVTLTSFEFSASRISGWRGAPFVCRSTRDFNEGLFFFSVRLNDKFIHVRREEEGKQIIARLHILLTLKSLLIIWTARFLCSFFTDIYGGKWKERNKTMEFAWYIWSGVHCIYASARSGDGQILCPSLSAKSVPTSYFLYFIWRPPIVANYAIPSRAEPNHKNPMKTSLFLY